MILKTKHTEKNLEKLDLITISYVLAYYAALFLPHKLIGGGVLLDGKTIIATLMFSAFALYITSRFSTEEAILDKSPVSMPLAALTMLIIFASLFAQNKPIALEATLLFLAYIGCFYIFLSMLGQKNQQVSLVYIIIVITLFLCITGLVQYHLFNLNPRLTSIWRLRATFGNSNQMAGFLSMTIPVYTGLMLTKKFSKPKFLMLCIVLIIMTIALFFTFARGGWISTFIATSFILFFYMPGSKKHVIKNFRIAMFIFLALSLFFLSSTDLVKRFNTITQQETEVSLYGRLLAWKGTIEMIKTNPVNGVGPGNYSKAFRGFQPPGLMKPYIFAHNDYLQFISETGVLLIPIIIWLVYSLFAHGFSKIKYADRQIRGITLGAMGGIIAILLYSAGDFNLHIPANTLLFTVLAAIVAAPVSENKIGESK